MLKTILPLDFDDISNMLVALGAHASPSEIHGYLSGLLAAGKRLSDKQWLEEAQVLIDADNDISPANQEAFICIYANTLASLADENYGFYPLLADDIHSLETRLSCLATWCQGFMVGFALVEKTVNDLSDTVNDALHDMAAITRVDTELEQDNDNSANDDYTQLVEYVRLASMSIFAEYAKETAPAPAKEPSGMSVQNLFRNRQLH